MNSTDYLPDYKRLLEYFGFEDITSGNEKLRSTELAFYQNDVYSINLDGVNISLLRNNTGILDRLPMNDENIIHAILICTMKMDHHDFDISRISNPDTTIDFIKKLIGNRLQKIRQK